MLKPPHSIEIEQAILSLLIQDKKSHYVIDKLNAEEFYNTHHQLLFEAIKKLYSDGLNIDLITVFEEAKKLGNIEIKYINDLVLRVSVYDTLENYIAILKEKAVLRSIINKCTETVAKAFDEVDPVELKVSLAQSLDEISVHKTEGKHHLKDIFHTILDDIENYDEAEAKKQLTGFEDLDARTHGIFKEEVTVIAARPSAGKTALALQIGTNLAINNLRVYIVSREMSKGQMGKRLLTSRGIDGASLKTNKLSEQEEAKMINLMGHLSNLDIFIDTESKTVAEIKQKIREFKADVLIIDYLQLLEPSNRKAPREQQVSEISRDIKNISLDFKMRVILLSQMSRQAAARRPILADLRESGAIEQDANNVWFIHVPQEEELKEIYSKDNSPINLEIIQKINRIGARLVEIIIAKQRDGETGSFYALYIPNKLKFTTMKLQGGYHG